MGMFTARPCNTISTFFADRKAAHILSAFATEPGLVRGDIDCDKKSNKIPAVRKMVAKFGLVDALATAAQSTDKRTFEAPAEAGRSHHRAGRSQAAKFA